MKSEYLKRLGAQGHLRVKQALRDWDPIGVYSDGDDWPDDEYDSYSGPVVALLDAGADRGRIIAYLKRVCEVTIGVGFDRPRTEKMVDELLLFWPEWKRRLRELGEESLVE